MNNRPRTYICYKCNYTHTKKYNLIKHFNRKKKCLRHQECQYTDEEIQILNEAQFNKDDYAKIQNGQIAEIINNIETQNNITNNITTQNNIQHQNQNIINIHINKLVGFNDDWVIDNLNENQKSNLLVTKLMYTQLIKMILENEFNHNVIIENEESTHGLIFKKINNEKKYEVISIETLIDESMKKLHKQLTSIYDNFSKENESYFDDNSFRDHISKQKDAADEKINNYINDKNTHEQVLKIIKDIYITNKDRAINNQKLVLEHNKYENGY
jgi:hypothetical protein